MTTLKQYRILAELKQRDVAQKLCISEALLSMIENSKRSLRLSQAVELSKLYNVPLVKIIESALTK